MIDLTEMEEQPGPPKLFLAQIFLEQNQPQKALELLRSADTDTIDTPFFWLLRGRANYDLARFHDAYQAAQKGLAVSPENIPLLSLTCDIHSKWHSLAKAEQAILLALKINPLDPFLLCRYALLVAQGGQLEKAERLVTEAANLAPEHPAVSRSQIILAYLRGDDRQTTLLSEAVLRKEPEDVLGHYMKAGALAQQGRVSDANQSFNQAVRLNPMQKNLAHSARQSRTYAHWLLLPLRPIYRFGPIPVWIFSVGTAFFLRAMGLEQASNIFIIVYIFYAIYSWVIPPLLKRWLQRHYRSFK